MSWRNNKKYNEEYKDFDVLYVKTTNPDIKKLRVINWLKTRKEELLHGIKSNY